ncbi:MAG: RNA pseudouridine synthase, partial [Mesorhizobium sp.]
MDDDKKSPRGSRKGGSKPAGPRGGKPAHGAKKPFPKRERPMAAEGERNFKRYEPRETGPREAGAERGDRSFRKGPPRDGKPFEKREGRKPFVPRGDRPVAAEG